MNDDLDARLQYTIDHGLFDAANAGKAVTFYELQNRITALEAEVARLADALGAARDALGEMTLGELRGKLAKLAANKTTAANAHEIDGAYFSWNETQYLSGIEGRDMIAAKEPT